MPEKPYYMQFAEKDVVFHRRFSDAHDAGIWQGMNHIIHNKVVNSTFPRETELSNIYIEIRKQTDIAYRMAGYSFEELEPSTEDKAFWVKATPNWMKHG